MYFSIVSQFVKFITYIPLIHSDFHSCLNNHFGASQIINVFVSISLMVWEILEDGRTEWPTNGPTDGNVDSWGSVVDPKNDMFFMDAKKNMVPYIKLTLCHDSTEQSIVFLAPFRYTVPPVIFKRCLAFLNTHAESLNKIRTSLLDLVCSRIALYNKWLSSAIFWIITW